jgi:hypothetical protein
MHFQETCIYKVQFCAYLFYPRPQKASDEELESLQFRLYDDQLEIRLGIHVARLVFDKFNLPAPLATSDPDTWIPFKANPPAFVSCPVLYP